MSYLKLHNKCLNIFIDIYKNQLKNIDITYKPFEEFKICYNCLDTILGAFELEKNKMEIKKESENLKEQYYKDLIDGFYCAKCESNKYTFLRLNGDNQLNYFCFNCFRKWI